MFLLNCQD